MSRKSIKFLNISELNNILSEKINSVLVIWGAGLFADELYDTLTGYDIAVSYIGDSDPVQWGTYKNGLRIISPQELCELNNVVVLIGSFGYVPIYEMLQKMGLQDVYGFMGAVRYGSKVAIEEYHVIFDQENNGLSVEREEKKCFRVLVELYGNIGDTALRVGEVKAVIDRLGVQNVWLIFEDKSYAELFYFITPNIYIIDSIKIRQDKNYRIDFFKELKRKNFSQSIILCDIRIYATRRYLNSLNSNITRVLAYSEVPDTEYLMGMEYPFVRKVLGLKDDYCLTPQGIIDEEVEKILLPVQLTNPYVVLHMGSSKDVRLYDKPEVYFKIISYLNALGFAVVILGYGNIDERFVNKIYDCTNFAGGCINCIDLVSKLSVCESAKVIKNAAFFIGTDSGMWNISYVLGKHSVVLYGGGEYGCFKHHDDKIYYVTVDDHRCFGCKWYCNNKDAHGYAKCMSEITYDMIIKGIDSTLMKIQSEG